MDTPLLISPQELAVWCESIEPPLILDARYRGPATAESARPDFEAGHIPGSRWVDVDSVLSAHGGTGVNGGRHPLPSAQAFQDSLRALGVRQNSRIVVLDGANSLSAARLWWMLADAGIEGVRVLDGGYAAWEALGLAVETGPGETGPEPVSESADVVVSAGRMPSVSVDQVLELSAALGARAGGEGGAGAQIWDVRTPERYRGESEPIDPVAGHIPGAENLPASQLQNPDGTFRSPDALAQLFAGVEPGDVLYCGSGLTAAQAALAARLGGLEGVRVYAGSWSEWIEDPQRPVARG